MAATKDFDVNKRRLLLVLVVDHETSVQECANECKLPIAVAYLPAIHPCNE